jgi:hypothetical protein
MIVFYPSNAESSLPETSEVLFSFGAREILDLDVEIKPEEPAHDFDESYHGVTESPNQDSGNFLPISGHSHNVFDGKTQRLFLVEPNKLTRDGLSANVAIC